MTVMIVFSVNEGGFGRKMAEISIQTFYTGAMVSTASPQIVNSN